MAESFDDFASLDVIINGAKAAMGATQVVSALKAIQDSSRRTAQIMEQELEQRAALRVAAAASRTAREQASAARAAQREIEKAARAGAAAVEKAEREKAAAAAKSAKEQAAAAKNAAKEQQKAMDDTKASANSLRNAMIAAATGAVATSVVKTIASYEQLKASLVTVEKSQSAANSTFAELQKFAAVTPFTTEQATKAWIRMRAAGLEPTIDKLRAFGDASSIVAGKDVLDFVEAVADATQGGKVRLKEFGIDMDKAGGKVRLAFGDMAVVVKNDAKSIEQGLIQLTKTNFGGAMERQSKTLAGVWSTLQDSAANLAMEVGEGGLLQAMKDVVNELTNTTTGGENTARALGAALGDAVRATAAGAKFLAEHMAEVKAVLGAILAYKTATFFASMVTGFRAATAAAGGFRAAMLATAAANPFAWVAVGIGLLIELHERWDDIMGLPGAVKDKVQGGMSWLGDATKKISAHAKAQGAPSEGDLSAFVEWMQLGAEKGMSAYQGFAKASASPKGKPKGPGGGGSGFGAKKTPVDHMAESLSDLRIQAAAAAEAFGLFAGDPADAKGLEVQNRLLEWRNKLLDQGVDPAKIEAQSAAALGLITNSVNAEYATQHLKDFTEALAGLKTEAANAEEILGLVMGGASARDLEVATRMQGLTAGKSFTADEVTQLRAKVEATVDAALATKKLQDEEKAYQDAAQKSAEDAAKAAADAEKAAMERRKQIQEEWLDFATSGIERFGDTLSAALDGQEHAWRDFFIQLATQAASLALTQGFSDGGALTGLFTNAAVHHSGGMVGAGGSRRSVGIGIFAHAPRYHSGGYAGLRSDEVPAILQRGERVLSRREVAQGGIGGRSNRNYSIAIHLSGVTDGASLHRSMPTLIRRLQQITRRDDD